MDWLILVLSDAPAPSFLSDVAAFEAILISVAVPLSFEIISRLSERYSSGLIAKHFKRRFPVRVLPWLLICSILLAVALRFFVRDNPTAPVWKVAAWSVFGLFILTAFVLMWFFWILMKYVSDTEYVLERFFDEAEEAIR